MCGWVSDRSWSHGKHVSRFERKRCSGQMFVCCGAVPGAKTETIHICISMESMQIQSECCTNINILKL